MIPASAANCRTPFRYHEAMTDNLYSRLPRPDLLADLILASHVLVVAFVVLGLVLTLIGAALGWQWVRNRVFRIAHLAVIAFVVVQTWLGQLCPLTIWEHELRIAAGQSGFEVSFIEHWLSQLLYVDLPWWVFITAYTAFGLLVVASWWLVPPQRKLHSG